MKASRRLALRWLIVVMVLNLVSFCLIALLLGGDALNGVVKNGHYYLGYGRNLTEVSPFVWWYSAIHAFGTFVTHFLGALAAVLLELEKRSDRKKQKHFYEQRHPVK